MVARVLVLSDSIGKRLHPSVLFFVRGIGGYTAWDCLNDITHGVLDRHLGESDRVILLLGTNDIPLNIPNHVAQIIVSCAQALVARKRSLEVVICGIIPRAQDNGLYSTAIKAANRCLEKLCACVNVKFIKIFKPFFARSALRADYISKDGLHPSPRGLKCIFNALCDVAQDPVPRHLFHAKVFHGPDEPLSNFHPAVININSREHPHVERAYMLQKAVVCNFSMQVYVQNAYENVSTTNVILQISQN
jgi:hypothetical protein